ncbi:peroxiredoxin family protein [Balneola sp. MJW-20]|uniref:peroxiredoxin family protein n=1 Tax=Gracilimonas aurantiaca TaxID=3234185 RepID=UPI003467078C
MKLATLLLLTTSIIISSCDRYLSPEEFLDQARSALYDHEGFTYSSKAFYPNPTGKIDTVQFTVAFERSDSSPIGYNYIISRKSEVGDRDLILTGNDYKVVSHKERLVMFYPEEESEKEEDQVKNALPIKNSMIRYLRQTDWTFAGDTVINDQSYKNYSRIDADYMYNENKILVEQHIFINESSKLIDRFERRNYFNGELAQLVSYEFSDFRPQSANEPLSYDYPDNYRTSLLGASPDENLLKVGQKAPDFVTRDEEGNIIQLADYRGGKVLLDFSIINCGYCLQSLRHFNRDNYEISDELTAVYINPLDSQSAMTEFNNQYNVPFPVILSDAAEIAQKYGAFIYPLFYLIDEEGIIEKVIIGYDEEFQESLKSL